MPSGESTKPLALAKLTMRTYSQPKRKEQTDSTQMTTWTVKGSEGLAEGDGCPSLQIHEGEGATLEQEFSAAHHHGGA